VEGRSGSKIWRTVFEIGGPTEAQIGLVVNVIVLWNTIYMDAALNQLRKEGVPVQDDDVTHLSPLGHDINMLGRYAFTLPDRIARGELRPLRDPKQLVDEAA
jgi:hypothetical protein